MKPSSSPREGHMLETFDSFITAPETNSSLSGRKLKSWWQKRKISPRLKEVKKEKGEEAQKEDKEEVSPWEADYQLLVCEGLFSEYLEMGKSTSVVQELRTSPDPEPELVNPPRSQ